MKQNSSTSSLSVVVSWKIQLISALVFSIVVLIHTAVFKGHSPWKLVNNFTANFLFIVLLWQGAFVVFRLIPEQYSWETRLWPYLVIATVSGYGASICILAFIEYTYSVISPIDPFPRFPEFVTNVHISFLLLAIMLAVINLILYFRNYKEKQLKEAGQKYERYYEQLLNRVDDVIQVVDSDGKVVFSNAAIESLGGYTVAEAKAIDPFHWVHPEDKERIQQEFEGLVLRKGESRQTQYRVVSKTGTIKHVETRVVNALGENGVGGFIATVRDVTKRIESDNKLKAQNLSYQLLMEMSKTFLSEPLPRALEHALSSLGRFAGVDRVYVYRLNKRSSHWNCLHEWRSEEGNKVESLYYQTGASTADLGWVYEQFKTGQIINVTSLDELPPEAKSCKEMFEADGTKSILLLPMRVNDNVIGFIGYDAIFENKTWHEDDITTVRICNEILASAIIRNDAEQSTKESLSFNKGIIESTAEGILLTDLEDNIVTYNAAFKKMWQLTDDMLVLQKKSVALQHALRNLENGSDIVDLVDYADRNVSESSQFIARFKNGRVLEGISVPQVIDGKFVGRIWSSRDITDRINSEREEIEKGVAQAQFESLKNQVNPHFLFNSLNVLSSLVHIDADLSEKFIDQLARSYRYLLEQKDKELVPLKTEIEFVQSFSFLLKIRFEEKLRINIKLPAESMNDLIAPLTLQLLIENAVKHNTISLEQPLIIDLYLDEENYLVVRNNLQIRVQRMPSTGVGLKNIISRYKLLTTVIPEFQILNDAYIARIPLIKNTW